MSVTPTNLILINILYAKIRFDPMRNNEAIINHRGWPGTDMIFATIASVSSEPTMIARVAPGLQRRPIFVTINPPANEPII